MSNAYLERMNELKAQRSNPNRAYPQPGMPISRPGSSVESPSGVPTGEAPLPPGEDESYKDSHFYSAMNYYTENDPRFGNMFSELQKLASGLREQVNSGYMPPQLARQRLTQFVGDTMSQFEREAPRFKKEDEQAKMQQLLGALTNQAGQQAQQEQQSQANAPTPPEGISQQEAMNQQQFGGSGNGV